MLAQGEDAMWQKGLGGRDSPSVMGTMSVMADCCETPCPGETGLAIAVVAVVVVVVVAVRRVTGCGRRNPPPLLLKCGFLGAF